MGSYAEATDLRINLATELPWPPSGHRPDGRQAQHTHIPEIGFLPSDATSKYTGGRSAWCSPSDRDRKESAGRDSLKESRPIPAEAHLARPNYASDLLQPSLPEHKVIRHIALAPIPKDIVVVVPILIRVL